MIFRKTINQLEKAGPIISLLQYETPSLPLWQQTYKVACGTEQQLSTDQYISTAPLTAVTHIQTI